MNRRILIVEDEPHMQTGLRDNLEFEGYDVEVAGDGETGLHAMLEGGFDLVILDVMLPKRSGFDVCRMARHKGCTSSILMLTAKGEEIDKVLGLELGADDYLTKPFGLRELLARVKALLRRQARQTEAGSPRIRLGRLELDLEGYEALCDGEPAGMSHLEFEVLRYLYEHRGRTVSRDQLLEQVWGYENSPTSRTVDNFILKLRQKIETDPSAPRHILTVHGVGYKLVAADNR